MVIEYPLFFNGFFLYYCGMNKFFQFFYYYLAPLGKYDLARLPMTMAIGSYIAFCPFIGLHTVFTIILSWLFALNMPHLFFISCSINNPWTMVPIYATGHLIGQQICAWFGWHTIMYNPGWLSWINKTIIAITPSGGFSLWAFLLGGNILALTSAAGFYLIGRLLLKQHNGRTT